MQHRVNMDIISDRPPKQTSGKSMQYLKTIETLAHAHSDSYDEITIIVKPKALQLMGLSQLTESNKLEDAANSLKKVFPNHCLTGYGICPKDWLNKAPDEKSACIIFQGEGDSAVNACEIVFDASGDKFVVELHPINDDD